MTKRTHRRRIMRGQVAALCGLVLAGVRVGKASEIVGSTYWLMRPYIPAAYIERGGRGIYRWNGEELEDLKEVYHNPGMTLRQVGELFGITESAVRLVAKRKGWRYRRQPHPTTVSTLPEPQRRRYRKMRAVLGRERAYVEAVAP